MYTYIFKEIQQVSHIHESVAIEVRLVAGFDTTPEFQKQQKIGDVGGSVTIQVSGLVRGDIDDGIDFR